MVYDSKLPVILHSFKDILIERFCLWAQSVKWHIDYRIVEIKDREPEWV